MSPQSHHAIIPLFFDYYYPFKSKHTHHIRDRKPLFSKIHIRIITLSIEETKRIE